MFHPTRGGTRGGRDQFNWEDVKEDKHRENYLGHSLMAPIGRWQKGKDLNWYSKESKDDTKSKANMLELQKIKEAEAEAMAIALGVKKKKTLESKVTEDELKHALNKTNNDSDDEKIDISAEKGLGYGKSSRFPQQEQQIANMEIMNAGHNAVASYRHNDNKEEEEQRKEKKKSKKHHKSSSSSSSRKHHRHHDSDEERHSKRRHREDNSSRREHRRHDDSKRRYRERSTSRDDDRRDRHSSSRHSRSDKERSSRRDVETKRSRSRSRSLSPYSKRLQMSRNQ